MVNAKYSSLFALLAILSTAINAAPLKSGVCYSPWHHASVNADVVGKDFAQVRQHFSSVRTFHASFSGVNVVDAANAAGLKVAVGIMMNDKAGVAKEIQAACEGAKRHPSTVEAIYVGNENLAPAGPYSAQELIGYIQQLKACTAGTNIPVGTVQRINEWLNAPGIKDVAAACDKVGTNIYPFFTPGSKTPMEKFMDQYKQITSQYPADKVIITETGWPRSGSPSPQGNVPSTQTTQTFFNEYSKWAENYPQSYYFMMFDTTNAYGGGDYETSFGLANKDGQMQIQIPSGGGGGGQGPAPGPAPAPAVTPAASTPGQAPAPAPAPTTPSPVMSPAILRPYPDQNPIQNQNPPTPPPTTQASNSYCA